MEDITSYYLSHPATQQPPLAPSLSDVHSSFYSHHRHYTLPTTSRLSHREQVLPPAPPPVPLHFVHRNLSPQHHISSSLTSLSDASPHDDEVRTLFIAGLPEDVKHREIYHLFLDFPGYLSSNLRTPSGKSVPFAFAVFADHKSAVAAMHELNGMVFDLEKGSTLHVDLAKSNSRSKRQRAGKERLGLDKKHRVSPIVSRDDVETGVGCFHLSGMDNPSYNLVGYTPSQSDMSFNYRGNIDANTAQSAEYYALQYIRRYHYTHQLTRSKQDKSPCPTIFVANLGPKCSDKELHQVFSRCRGFLKLKTQGTYGAPVAFVDFKDTACSTEALVQLQGTILNSSPGGEGIRLEYAKSRMGKRSRAK